MPRKSRLLSAVSAVALASALLATASTASAIESPASVSEPPASQQEITLEDGEPGGETPVPVEGDADTSDTPATEPLTSDEKSDTGESEIGLTPFAEEPQSGEFATAIDPIDISVLYSNDFHGRIEGMLSGDRTFLTRSLTMRFAATLERARQEFGAGNSLYISGGDDLGATLFASNIQDEQPTIDFLNAIGLQAMAVGNHEFNRGWEHLVNEFSGDLDAPILGANVYLAGTQDPVLPEYTIVTRAGVKIAIIGVTTASVPTLTNPANVVGLDFGNPVEAVNRVTAELEALPDDERPAVILAVYHDGSRSSSLEQGIQDSPTFRAIVEDTDARVDAIFTAHTHFTYVWDAPVPGEDGKTRPVIQSGRHGSHVGQVVLSVDPATNSVVSATARNITTIAPQNANENFILELTETWGLQQEYDIVYDAVLYADDLGSMPAGTLTGPITRAFTNGHFEDGLWVNGGSASRAQASALGTMITNVLRDSLEEVFGTQFGVMNSGGIRDDLIPNEGGVVTVAQVQAVLPFSNELTVVDMTGEQIYRALEQQWQCRGGGVVDYLDLALSDNISYTFAEVASPDCDETPMGVVLSVAIDGQPVSRDQTVYSAATINFLAGGGDGFSVFTEGEATETGLLDLENFLGYLDHNSPVSPDFSRSGVRAEGLTDTTLKGGTARTVTLSGMNVFSAGAPENTLIELSLHQGDQVIELGGFPMQDDVMEATFDVPLNMKGQATFHALSVHTGTEVVVPVSVSQEEEPPTEPGDGENENGSGTEDGADSGAAKPEGDLADTGASIVGTLALAALAIAGGSLALRRTSAVRR